MVYAFDPVVQETTCLFYAVPLNVCICLRNFDLCIHLKLWHPVAIRMVKEVSKMVLSHRCRASSRDPLLPS